MAAPPAALEPAAPVARPSSYRSMEVDSPYIALTFDDGPNPETTPKLLKILAERNIKATFFVLGTNAAAYPDVIRSIAAAGHEIGNHSWNHPQLPKLTLAAADKQIEDTAAAVESATGKKPIYLRPPYGAMTPALQQHIVQKYDMMLIFWSVDPLDWKIREAQSIYDQIMKQVRPGSIVLAHDIHATTVAAMPRVLDALIAKGYKFATVSELIAMNKPGAPKVVAALAPAPPRKKTRPAPRPGTAGATQGAPRHANNVNAGLY
ncbi:polysaccharide deacetylase family protein [Xanthobacter sp. DSM 24535]|uniref:polysaccharide deacetylase family protein n=1 Tax=Roseixanthobacter psychrophilus TaxID=3119917 RepID=UPI0037275096